ncbi:DUF7373 family lipoprotein [Nocardia grenadensis]|uniref:DUF7373 family lipoprotein n=1 Tax=Nocardia grenadensis TaxID=931537 RepID=UPI003D913F33
MTAFVSAVSVVTTACAQTVTGHAGPGMAPVTITELDHGLFPTEPTKFEMEINTSADIYSLESRRMLGSLISPYQVDPDFRYLQDTELIAAGTSPTPNLLPTEFEPIAEKNFFVSGVVTARANNNPRTEKRLAVAVLRFGNDDYARTAATEYNTAMDVLAPGRQRIDIAGYGEAHAALAPGRDRAQLFAATGPFVVVAAMSAPPGEVALAGERLRKLLDLQFGALQSLVPTPPDDMLDLPTDPDGIMSMTLPGDFQGSAAFSDLLGAYSPSAYLHMEPDAEAIHDYEAYGVDLVARNNATVYRAAGPSQAFALQTALTRPGRYDERIDEPPGLGDARCVQRDYHTALFQTFFCVVVYDRYVALVDDTGLGKLPSPELHQGLAAQYAILANSR